MQKTFAKAQVDTHAYMKYRYKYALISQLAYRN